MTNQLEPRRWRWEQAMTFVAPMSRDRWRRTGSRRHRVDLSLLALNETGDDCDAAVHAFVDVCEAAEIELLPEVRSCST